MTDRGAEPDAPVGGRIVVDGRPVPFEPDDSVAIAIVRAGDVPGRGGTLCLAGDCGNCLATVNGVAYVRTCQVAALPGTVVGRHPAEGKPALPSVDLRDLARVPLGPDIPVRRAHAGLAIVGGGSSERAAAEGRDGALVLDAADGIEVVGIYPGPAAVAREPGGMLHLEADEIVVATGSAEIHPVCPGSRLAGIVTARAAERLAAADIDLGRAVTITTHPIRFEDDGSGRVGAVVVAGEDGSEVTLPCETAIVDLGRAPRDVLARMTRDPGVRAVGSAALDHPLPPSPIEGVVCPCMGTTVADLETAFDKGYNELELLKRASWAGLGPCQGGACLPHVRAFIAARTGGPPPDPFTARPAARQITLAEAAADTTIDAFRRTPLHAEHLAFGARMDRFGGWFRPWHYGDVVGEYWAVREGVSIGDVSTLGKLIVSGPDVVEALERIYPCHV
ncbi:MAG: (2Fe-2S)-binding protein, partial [Chloroflexi bacterium]|nr:(2Fe-2S)-binding protein [Chloroflexota bacterium]